MARHDYRATFNPYRPAPSLAAFLSLSPIVLVPPSEGRREGQRDPLRQIGLDEPATPRRANVALKRSGLTLGEISASEFGDYPRQTPGLFAPGSGMTPKAFRTLRPARRRS